jgi:hypothetical protein
MLSTSISQRLRLLPGVRHDIVGLCSTHPILPHPAPILCFVIRMYRYAVVTDSGMHAPPPGPKSEFDGGAPFQSLSFFRLPSPNQLWQPKNLPNLE